MNTNPLKKEYSSDDDIERLLKSGTTIQVPSEGSFRSMLRSLPERRVKSPYSFQQFLVVVKRRALPILAILLVIGGGAMYVHRTLVPQSQNAEVVADASSDAQLDAIDAQLGSLDMDNSTVDQVLSHQTH